MRKITPKLSALVLSLILVIGCSIDEVQIPTIGTLYFRASNLQNASEPVPGRLYHQGNLLGQFNSGYLELAMPLDSTMALNFRPDAEDDWFPLLEHLWKFPPGQDVDTVNLSLLPIADSLFSIMLYPESPGGTVHNMPFTLDGVPWPVPAPTHILFSPTVLHEVVFGDEECVRGSGEFTYFDAPLPTDILQLPVSSIVYEMHTPYIFLLDEVIYEWGITLFFPNVQTYFLSAFQEGMATRPSSYVFRTLCPFDGTFSYDAVDPGYEAGLLFPDFELTEVEPGVPEAEQTGDLFSLKQMRGRITLVNFWFIDCQACQEEMPHFQELLDEYGDQGFRILALDPLPDDDPENYPDYDFHFLQDDGATPVAQLAGITAFPTNIIVQPDGVIRSRHGALSRDALEEIILELIDEFSDGLPD